MSYVDKLIIGLCTGFVVIIGGWLLISNNPVGAGEFFGEVWLGIKILFFSGLACGLAYVYVRIRQANQYKIVRDRGGDGTVRAVIQLPRRSTSGQIVQIAAAAESNTVDAFRAEQAKIRMLRDLLHLGKVVDANTPEPEDDEWVYLDADGNEVDPTQQRPQIESPRNPAEHLYISDRHQSHANEFLSNKKLFVGETGAGKSNSVAVTCEELGRLKVPFLLADTENEYELLADQRYIPYAVLAGADVPNCTVTVESAERFGRYVVENNLQVILNLQSYEMEEAAQVMVNIIGGVREWEEERDNSVRIPFEFLLEEATTWLPQNIKESPLYGTEVLNSLQNVFFNDLVRKGRKRGLGLTVICQKIAEIDKRALQCRYKLLHRQSELIDLEKYSKMGITNEETLSLAPGEAFLFTPKVSKLRLQIRERYTEHGADTPGLEQLKRYQREKRPRNSGESWSEIPAEREISTGEVEAFVPPSERFRVISGNVSQTASTAKRTVEDVPAEIRNQIENLYSERYDRTAIQRQLKISGENYWMVKEVCNAYDQAQEA